MDPKPTIRHSPRGMHVQCQVCLAAIQEESESREIPLIAWTLEPEGLLNGVQVRAHWSHSIFARINLSCLWEHRVQDVSFNGDSEQYRKQAESCGTTSNPQVLQIVTGTPLALVGGGSTVVPLALVPPPLECCKTRNTLTGPVGAQWLARLEYFQKDLQDVQYKIVEPPEDEQQVVPFTEVVMVDELLVNCRTPTIAEYDSMTDPQEHLSHFENATLRYTNEIKCHVFFTTLAKAIQQCNQKLWKMELSLFAIRQKENESLKEYLQRFNATILELRDTPLEKVNTSLYGFAGELVHPRDMISLVDHRERIQSKDMSCKFLVVDTPSTYNAILGRPTLNAFQVVISTYYMKIKFPTAGGVGEVQGNPLQSRKCYVEAVCKGQKWNTKEESREGDTLYLYISATSQAVSSVLIPEDGGKQVPIYYVSKVLNRTEEQCTLIEKMTLALVITARQLRLYFLSQLIGVKKNMPLKKSLGKLDTFGRLVKWAIELSEYDISYQPRTTIKAYALVDFV
ncbi:Retrovirus-related Pol polyprotein from transposon opus [Sesamum angolense]|uniref:Retrovirus-related Pol polyprotein from transposon opus n=1 Tax=Sesamum angolense TaxID=2727404 RepID=A0AAE1WMN0_9LAMI|nr:Retrovirus-related Pol polyprotein from transposon opus [Sesamum angolense]